MNEESASIKKNISALIKLLLNKLDAGHKDELFEVVMAWFQEKKVDTYEGKFIVKVAYLAPVY